MHRLPLRVWFLFLLWQAMLPAWAGELPTAVSLTTWGRAEGLPQSTVTGIAPAADGSLWITTSGGLARFDGERASVQAPGPGTVGKVSRLTALAVDPTRSGRLFLGTESYGVWIFEDGIYAQPRQPAVLQATGVHSIEVDGDGQGFPTTFESTSSSPPSPPRGPAWGFPPSRPS